MNNHEFQHLLRENNIEEFPDVYSFDLSLSHAFKKKCAHTPIEISQEVIGDHISQDEQGNLEISGSPVFAYIRRPRSKNLPKVHFVYCRTVMDMPTGKFFCTNRNDGLFEVDIQDGKGNLHETRDFELEPCLNCVGKYYGIPDGKEYRQDRVRLAEGITLRDIQIEIGNTLNVYAWRSALYKFSEKPWEDISWEVRSNAHWTCQHCNLHIGEEYSSFLHTHHKHESRNFNHTSNLIALCLRCHADQPGHETLKNSKYDKFLQMIENGIFMPVEPK